MRILLVEDEAAMARLVAARLAAAGFIVDHVATGEAALAAAAMAPYALALLDRRLPDGDGALLVRPLRLVRPGIAIIMLSALDAVADRITGLDAGADDYLAKPFDMAELLARMRAALRRPGAPPAPAITCGSLSFDAATREVAVAGQPLVLRRRELAVLERLMTRAGRVVPREALAEAAFGFDDEAQPNALETQVSRLRGRLAAAGAEVVIHPVRGVGWMLDRA